MIGAAVNLPAQARAPAPRQVSAPRRHSCRRRLLTQRSRRERGRLAVAAAAAEASGGAGAATAPTTTTATTTSTTPTSFSRARTLSRQQQLHPSLLRPLSPEQRRWLAALGISDATIARHGIAAQAVAHPLLPPAPHAADGGESAATVDAVAVPYYESGRLVDARYYVLAPATAADDDEEEQEEEDEHGGGGGGGLRCRPTPPPSAEAAAGLVVAASWMARGGRALYVAGEGAMGGAGALLRATGDVVVVGDELDALAVAEAFEQEQQEWQQHGGEGGEEAGGSGAPPPPPPPPRPTVVAIPQPLPSWRRDVPLYSDPRRRLYHLSQQLQRAREEEQRRRDREGFAPPATGGGRRRQEAQAADDGGGGGGGGGSGNGGGGGGNNGSGGMIDYLMPRASSVVFACRASAKGSLAAALNRQRQQWEERQRQRVLSGDEEEEDENGAGGGGRSNNTNSHNPAPDAALDGAAADEALAAEAARLFGEARCKTVQWPQAWTDHWERWQDGSAGGGEGGGAPAAAAAAAADGGGGDTGLRCGALHMLLADGGRALRLYVSHPREWPIAGLQRFFDYADEIYTAFGDFDDEGGGDGEGGGAGGGRAARNPLAYSTGWPSLDEYYRVAPGEVTLVTGVPNSGKSEWLDALAVNLAERHGWRFALCSMEKRSADHARQLLEKRARRPMLRGAAYATARGGQVPRMTEEELVAAFRWLDHHFVVLEASGGGGWGGGDHGGVGGGDFLFGGSGGGDAFGGGGGGAPTLEWILDRARAAVAKYGVRGLIIDPYNEIDHASARLSNGGGGGRGGGLLLEHEHVAAVMSSLRRFAQRHAVHVWLVAHPRQLPAWAGQAPTLMDVSGGANFMAKADNGVVVHRDWSRVARELAARPDAAPGLGGGSGASPAGGGRRGKAAAAAEAGGGEQQQDGEDGGGAAVAAAAAAAEAAQRRADFGVRIILAKVRNKTSGQRGEAALEYDPVTGRYREPSALAGGPPDDGDDDSTPPPWAGDPMPPPPSSSSYFAAAADASAFSTAPPSSHGQGGGGREEQQQQQQHEQEGDWLGEAAAAYASGPAAPTAAPAVERIALSGGAYAEVSAADAAAAAAAYDALLEAQLDDWEQGGDSGGGVGAAAAGALGAEDGSWLVNTRRARGLEEGEVVDFDDWTFERGG